MVAMAIVTSATQKAMSQLCCLATVLKGSPAMKAPTVRKKNGLQSIVEHHSEDTMWFINTWMSYAMSFEENALNIDVGPQGHRVFW